MKKTKKVKTLGKPERTKLPLRKFLNKFFIYNIFLTVGVAMLICSLTCMDVFTTEAGALDWTKITGNIVVSVLVLFAGLVGGLVYSLLLTYRGEEPLEQTFSKLTRWFFWVPVLGIVFDKIWKHKELKMNYAIKLSQHPEFKKPKMFLPSSVVIIFAALVGIVFLIWVLYIGGVIKSTHTDPSTGEVMPNVIPGILDIFLNPLRGFAGYDSASLGKYVNGVAGIAIFLLLFNGTMTLVNDAKAIDAGIGALLKKMKGKETILIPILMFILAICGSTFNMCEQLLPLFLVVIPIMFAAGFDAMTGFMLVFMSAGVGVMGSTVNPVLIGIASQAAGLESMTGGIVWRLILFVALTAASITCVILYAKKVKKNPQKSCVYMSDADFKNKYSFDKDALPPMTKRRKWTLIVFGIVFLLLIVGLIDWYQITGGTHGGWTGFQDLSNWLSKYFPFLTSILPIGSWGMVEAGMLFFIGSVIIGAINWQGCGHFIGTFFKGCAEFVPVAFILSVGKGLAITLTDSGLNFVIGNALGSALKAMSPVGAIFIIFIVVALLTIFIPSSSGLSSAMMPIVGPAVASAGTITVTGSVTTFAAAMGWMNIITPAGMLLPFLEVSKMDMGDYFKASWKQLAVLLVVGLALLSIGAYMPASLF